MRGIRVGWLAVAALASAGCYTLRPATLDEVLVRNPTQVWVTRPDNSVIVLEQPKLLGDTLAGHVNGTYEEIPAEGRSLVRMRAMASGRTAALIGISAASVLTMAAILAGGGASDNSPFPSCREDPTNINCV